MTIWYRDFPAALPVLGAVRIATTGQALTHCLFINPQAPPAPPSGWQRASNNAFLDQCQRLLDNYCSTGKLAMELPLAPQGTDFQRLVWDALLGIPAGETRTYTAIAHGVARPTAVRAVAAAIGRNPISVFIPCHRVIGSNGSLTGYAWGLERKAALLRLEGALS